MVALSEKKDFNGECPTCGCGYKEEDIKESIKKLQTLGLKNTPYPKYLILTIDDLKEVFGDALLGDNVK